jgi:beta-N-acetylhexosaminidase
VARPAARPVARTRPAPPPAAVAPRSPTTTAAARPQLTHRTLEQRLTPAQLAGQRIVYAYAGLVPPASLLRAIRAGEAAGVIFFAPNVSSAGQLRRVAAELQRAAAASPVRSPLLLMTDQEGGEVRRLPGPPVLSEKQIGRSASAAALARDAGAGAARTLAGAGLNVNLAPVLDVYRRAGNFIDRYQRSYSSDPARVAQLGGAFISGQQRAAVAATGKHFPGLGAASAAQNTDAEPVALNVPLGQLRTVDEAPYRRAIAAGVKLVMSSWAVYPALDPHLPAGLSPAVIGGELRRRLGFRGVTVTDAITAGSLAQFGGLGARGVLAARAGVDLILCSATNPADNTPSLGFSVRDALAAATRSGRVGRAGAEQAVARVLALRAHP